MKILAIASQKGGAGKSTLARALAVMALRDGIPTAIIDTDPQKTCVKWGSRRESAAPSVLPSDGAALSKLLDQLRQQGAGMVIIDTPPHLRAIVSMVAATAQAVLIPVRPSADDLEAVGDTVAILRATQTKAGIVINQAKMERAGVVQQARTALAVFGLPTCPATMVDRVVHQHASAAGQTAAEYEPGGKAEEETKKLWRWVNSTLL